VSDTPKTDAFREVVIGQYKEDELTGNGMGSILAALTDIDTLEHERNGWKTAHDVLQKLLSDTIKQRDEARGQLSAERALVEMFQKKLRNL
jgi:hypothetical protein